MLVLNKRQHINFWAKIDKSGICWEWTGSKNNGGYGLFGLNYKMRSAHRVSYEIKWGKIPDGLVINHMCRNRGCVNPDHLEVVTQKVNVQKGLAGFKTGLKNRAKTHCPQNHEYTPDNLTKQNNNKRNCKACNNDRIRARRARNKALDAGTLSVMGVDISN